MGSQQLSDEEITRKLHARPQIRERMMSCNGVKVVFADQLIAEIAKTKGCPHTVSFDKGAVRSAGMVQLALA
jgi:predicted nucleic-acid-binding protein